MTHNALAIDLGDWFSRAADPGERLVATDALVRRRYRDGDTLEIIRDDFNTLAARCCFGRYRPAQAGALSLSVNGPYRWTPATAAAGCSRRPPPTGRRIGTARARRLPSRRRRPPGRELIVFLKAWNEWAEGNYVEPDLKFGHGYLEVIRDEILR